MFHINNDGTGSQIVFVTLILLGGLVLTPLHAAVVKHDDFEVFGDFRARLEGDWDSQNSAGVPRDDRNRFRVRMRVGFRYEADDRWEFEMRLRSGNDDSQQSPHITLLDFDDNPTGPTDFNFDRWYGKVKFTKGIWAWAGRNNLPFWKQNDLVWTDDVTPAGVALGYSRAVGDRGTLAINSGYFSLPEGMTSFFGSLASGQFVYTRTLDTGEFTIAAGVLNIDADPEGSGMILLSGNDMRDYNIFVGSGQLKMQVVDRPMIFGIDLIENSKDAPGDETSGWVGSVRWGSTKERGDWLLAWYVARIEKFAVNNSFAQDDWVRWGNGPQTRGSDFKGTEFRFAYGLGSNSNLVARLYIVEALTSVEDGIRFRIDFNKRF